MSDDVTARLAEALQTSGIGHEQPPGYWEIVAAILTPAVQELIDEARDEGWRDGHYDGLAEGMGDV